jgi:hypothetical protein
MIDKSYIEIDSPPWLTKDGYVEVGVYIGEGACEPCHFDKVSLIDLIDKELSGFVSPLSNKIPDCHVREVKELQKSLKKAYKYAKKRAKELGYEN